MPELADWSPEEQVEVDRIEAGFPSVPRMLTYVVADCFVCGKVTIRRAGSGASRKCSNCGRPIAEFEVRCPDD